MFDYLFENKIRIRDGDYVSRAFPLPLRQVATHADENHRLADFIRHTHSNILRRRPGPAGGIPTTSIYTPAKVNCIYTYCQGIITFFDISRLSSWLVWGCSPLRARPARKFLGNQELRVKSCES